VDPVTLARQDYYRGYFADVLRGDVSTARSYYQRALERGAEEPELAARAALRLAQWAESSHRRRVALDLAVRASVLGAELGDVKAAADAMQRRLATVRAQDIEVRGPPAGTPLVGVSDAVAAQFAAAEKLLGSYHRRRLQPRLEALSASIRGKRAAMEAAIRAYREVAASRESVAVVAAEFRMASVYYDYSLSLSFELPSELDVDLASSLRAGLRSEVHEVRARARAAYERSLAAAADAGDAAERWREAAQLGLSSVNDLLRGGK
jgi:hypothetical protein